MARFVPEEYKAEGGLSPIGLLILLVSLCAAGAGLGWLASFIGQWFYLIVLFPAGIGLGLILVGIFVGRLARMRSQVVAVLLGLLSSGVAMLTMHYANYQRFLKEREELLRTAPPLDKLPANRIAPKFAEAVALLKRVRGVDGFFSYLNMEATQGVAFSSRGTTGANLGYVGTWIYWGVELAGVALMAAYGLVAGAAAPFCSACNVWKKSLQLGTLRGKLDDVAGCLIAGEIERLKEYAPAPAGGNLTLTAAICPKCETRSPISIKVEEVTKNARGGEEVAEHVHLTYPGEALPEFVALFRDGLEPKVEN